MKDLRTVRLETERLILRRIRKDDAKEAFQNWTNDEKVSQFVTWEPHGNVENTEKLFSIWEDDYNNQYTYRWGVEIKDTKELIGTIDVVHKSISQKTAEIGYCYGRKFWNQGYGTEALKKVIDFLFNEVGFELIEARHLVANPASGRVMEKAGMLYEATLRKRIAGFKSNERLDVKVYSIVK